MLLNLVKIHYLLVMVNNQFQKEKHLLKQIHGNDAHRYNIPEIGETIFIVDDFDGEMWKLKVKSLKTWDNGNSLEILCKGYRI